MYFKQFLYKCGFWLSCFSLTDFLRVLVLMFSFYTVFLKRYLFSVFIIPELFLIFSFTYLFGCYIFYLFQSYFFLPVTPKLLTNLQAKFEVKIQSLLNHFLKSFFVLLLFFMFMVLFLLYSLYFNNVSNLFSGYCCFDLLYFDGLTLFFKWFLSLIVLVLFVAFYRMSSFYPIETLFLVILILYAALLLVSSSNFIIFFTSLELFSISFIVLFYLLHNWYSGLSTVKYFLVSALSSSSILLGITILYGLYGTFYYKPIAMVLMISPDLGVGQDFFIVSWVAVLFIIGGFLIKLGAAPFHFWLPEVYENMPLLIMSYSLVFSKILFFYILFSFLNFTFMLFLVEFQDILLCVAFLSMFISSVVLINQPSIKKFVIFNSLVSTGILLFALASGSLNSSISFLTYLVLENFFSFFFLIMLGVLFSDRYLTERDLDSKNFSIYLLSSVRSYFVRLIVGVYCVIFSGIPPFGVFFLKFNIISSFVHEDFWFAGSFLFLIVMVISVVIYVRLLNLIFFLSPFDSTLSSDKSFFFSLRDGGTQHTIWPLDYMILWSICLFLTYPYVDEYIALGFSAFLG